MVKKKGTRISGSITINYGHNTEYNYVDEFTEGYANVN